MEFEECITCGNPASRFSATCEECDAILKQNPMWFAWVQRVAIREAERAVANALQATVPHEPPRG